MATSRPRVAIPLTYGLSVRYALPTGLLARLAEVCDLVVPLGWDDPELSALIEATGATASRLPDAVQDHEFRRIERFLQVPHERRLASPTTAISRRWRRRVQPVRSWLPTIARQQRDRIVAGRPRAEARLLEEEAGALDAHTNVAAYEAWLEANRIDAVVTLTPYHQNDQLLQWAARRRGLALVDAIISFDNPTTRGRLPVRGDTVLVWNDINRQQILRAYPDLSDDQVQVVGAPQFDLHHQPERIRPEPEWRRRLGLPSERPVILYGAGPVLAMPHEPLLVAAISDAIEAGRLPGRPVVLVRGHPADPAGRWQDLAPLPHVVIAPGWGRADGGLAWPSDDEIDDQMSTLAHSAVHVNICSSMSIDGAAFDRPVITPTTIPGAPRAAQRQIRAFYRQEHWEPIARSGGTTPVATLAELEAALARHLAQPELGREGRARLCADLLTWNDGQSSERVAAAVAGALGAVSEPRSPDS